MSEKISNILNEIEELRTRLWYEISFGYNWKRVKNVFVESKIEEKRRQLSDLIKSITFEEWKCLPENIKKQLADIWIAWKSTCPICNAELKKNMYEWGSFEHYDISLVLRCSKCGFEYSKDWVEPR